jgi:glycosyltransferase involved in cell wall biosynthesis
MIKNNSKERILVMAHGHPDLNKGGGEIAAFNLYNELKSRQDYEALFLGALPYGKFEKGTAISTRRKGELLFLTHMHDLFKFSNPNKFGLLNDFVDILNVFKPTIVHLHHYVHLGIEIIRIIKNYDPKIKIILTLHEYLAICHLRGQMVKSDSDKLCYSSKHYDCNKCVPEFSSQDFFLREQFIKSYFELVDLFISPSNFLIERYIKWGLDSKKLIMVENGQKPFEYVEKYEERTRNRFAFFGQINPFKGVEVLLKAVDKLPQKQKKKISVSIYGSGLEHQTSEYQQKIQALLKKTKAVVTYYGSYEENELSYHMQSTDWVIVPSIWWENSPMVIQEAFCHKRPVICSDIGGMAEKVIDKKTGIHFKRKDAQSLQEVVLDIIDEKYDWEELSKNISPPPSVEEIADRHIELFNQITK